MTTGPVLTWTVRDDTMREREALGGVLSAEFELHLMGAGGTVGDGRLVVAADDPALAHLIDLSDPADARACGGVVCRRRDGARVAVVASGVVTEVDIDADAGVATISWVPDDAITAAERAWTDPSTDIPTGYAVGTVAEYDTRTGSAGQVAAAYVAANIGPSAGVAWRRYPWLIIPTPASLAGVGATGTWQARDEALLDVLTRVAAGTGIVWAFTQASESTVAMTVRAPSTTPAARFSTVARTVTGAHLILARRTADTVIAGGGGDGIDRVRTRKVGHAVPAGSYRSVQWVQGQSGEYPDLQQAADEYLAGDDSSSNAEFTLTETPGMPVWGLDWQLGDVLSVATSGPGGVGLVPVDKPCVAVTVTQAAGQPTPTITPQIGSRDAVGQVTETAAVRALALKLTRR